MGEPTSSPAERFLHDDALVVRRTWASKWLWLAGAVLLAAVGVWWMTHPSGFASRGLYDGQTPAGQALYVGMLGPSSDSLRTLRLSDVNARVIAAPPGTETTVLLCRGGAIGTTSDAAAFCPELVDARGETFHYGAATMEQLVVRITAPSAGIVDLDGISLTFSEGLQFGTETVGPHLRLTVLAPPGATP